MKVASRWYAGFAALALVLAGIGLVAPKPAHAQDETVAALIAGTIITAAVVGAVILLSDEDEDEQPTSP